MRFDFQSLPATYVSRPNRFVVVARLDATGETVRAHCADPGRMRGLLTPNTHVFLSEAPHAEKRKTRYDLRFVTVPTDGNLVSVDSRLPNLVFAEAFRERSIAAFAAYSTLHKEVVVPLGDAERKQIRSRIDFCLEGEDAARMWVEVKSVTLVEGRVALFPDAPTNRGRRHVYELVNLAKRHGDRAAVVFIVQRADANLFRANHRIDLAFSNALESAARQGVEVYAYTCKVSLEEIRVDRPIAVVVSEAG